MKKIIIMQSNRTNIQKINIMHDFINDMDYVSMAEVEIDHFLEIV